MAHNPADDVPAPSVVDLDRKQTGASCPSDGTLVTLVGSREDLVLVGVCPLCHGSVYGSPALVSQIGTHDSNEVRQ
ncbi:MAG: hypothetical protein NVS1B2_15810 [Vulcanimicrobiaceae bacterium]